MDEDRQELIAMLCTAAGMIMEDVSTIAITSQEEPSAPRGGDRKRRS